MNSNPEQAASVPRHYIADNDAHFAFKSEWKKILGNRYTAEEIHQSDTLCTEDLWKRAEAEPEFLWPCP